jgi:septum formation protein
VAADEVQRSDFEATATLKYQREPFMTTSDKWILASASPRRREILAGIGLEFDVDPSSDPEPVEKPGETPSAYAVRAAEEKTSKVSAKYPTGLVIGADTIVVIGSHILGKPGSIEDAREMLGRLCGHWHEVITGICLYDISRQRLHSNFCVSRVHFQRMTADEIEWYIAKGEYRDKAGAYGIQGYASVFIDRLEGCFFNVVGFPVSTFYRLCRQMDINILQ